MINKTIGMLNSHNGLKVKIGVNTCLNTCNHQCETMFRVSRPVLIHLGAHKRF
jgi:hypothetical protein